MAVWKFRATLGSDAGALFVEVPFNVKEEFGRARPAVKVSVNGHRYRSRISVYGGKYYLPVRKEHREAAGVTAGDGVEVTLAPDTEVRKVEPPSDLARVLARNGRARAQWERLSYTCKKEYVEAILKAKKPETRARRTQKTLEKLTTRTR